MAGSVLLTSACTDFSDYNEAYTDVEVAGSNLSLMENISSDADLSDFAELVQRGGMTDKLKASQFYTIWAPKNGTFDKSKYDAMDSATLVKRFLENHIARGNVQLVGDISRRVHTLNEKSYRLEGSGVYTFGDFDVQAANKPSQNGVIHVLDGALEYRPNIYEYIFDAGDADSIQAYFKRYEHEVLDEQASVKGPIVDGMQTYLDSVVNITNTMTAMLSAKIENEDSSYTMLIPTDNAYKKAYDRISSSFNYIDEIPYTKLDFKGNSLTQTASSMKTESAYLQDSLTRLWIVGPTIFSNTDKYNRNGFAEGDITDNDTIHTTTSLWLSNVDEILSHTVNTGDMNMSNGYARIVDSLAYRPWETWNSGIAVSARSTTYAPGATTCTVSSDTCTVTIDGRGTYLLSYADYVPGSNAGAPQPYYYLPHVNSGAYNIYCVFVAPSTKRGVAAREYKINFTLEYAKTNGKTDKKEWKNVETEFYADVDLTTFTNANGLDTICITKDEPFTFPVSYNGLFSRDLPCAPYLTVKSARAAYNKSITTGRFKGKKEYDVYDNELRIAAIILRPVELDEYLKTKE